ncbi:unnamed protein product [Dicrocoelium dendriticum]|nr:unnamed protein product [Dicrocoelium dendriticum]
MQMTSAVRLGDQALPKHPAIPVYSRLNAASISRINSLPGVFATSTPITNTSTCRGKARRGRRSTIPAEQREQTRRLKKQNMERRRRACISDKLNALHSLAMNIIGIDFNSEHRWERADILTTCYKVFEGIAKIAREEPALQSSLQQIRSQLLCPATTFSTNETGDSGTHTVDHGKDESVICNPVASSENCENYPPIPRFSIRLSARPTYTPTSGTQPISLDKTRSWCTTDSGVCSPPDNIYTYSTEEPNEKLRQHSFRGFSSSHIPPSAPTEHSATSAPSLPRFRFTLSSISNSPLQRAHCRSHPAGNPPLLHRTSTYKRIKTSEPTGSSLVWRPYL